MYKDRLIQAHPKPQRLDGIKLYTIAINARPVNLAIFSLELERLKALHQRDWQHTAAFAIFHQGQSMAYLVLAYWGNDNELFTTVSVLTDNGWLVDAQQYSFYLWDMQVMWFERNSYIAHMYGEQPADIVAYRNDTYQA